MACPTCSHTMESINDVAVYRIFVCPRCGTVKTEVYTGDPNNWHVEVYVPKLVERCREFRKVMTDGADACEWARLGIAESIDLPENRPQ